MKQLAIENGTDTHGSELIGLIPEKALMDGFRTAEEAIHHLGLKDKAFAICNWIRKIHFIFFPEIANCKSQITKWKT